MGLCERLWDAVSLPRVLFDRRLRNHWTFRRLGAGIARLCLRAAGWLARAIGVCCARLQRGDGPDRSGAGVLVIHAGIKEVQESLQFDRRIVFQLDVDGGFRFRS